jgi:hypothetical protein
MSIHGGEWMQKSQDYWVEPERVRDRKCEVSE